MSGEDPPEVSSVGTAERPTEVVTEQLQLDGVTVATLVGLAFDAASSDGTAIFEGEDGEFDGEVTVRIDGEEYQVTGVNYKDPGGTLRNGIRWHRGPFVPSEELPDGTEVFLRVEEDWVGKEIALSGPGELQVEEDWVGKEIPPWVDLSITTTNSPVDAGDDLDVTFSVSRESDLAVSYELELVIDQGVGTVDSVSDTMDGDTVSQQKVLTWSTSSSDEGSFSAQGEADSEPGEPALASVDVTVSED